jgi:hypothetical protein
LRILPLRIHAAAIETIRLPGTKRKSGNPGKNQDYSGDFHRASGYTTICTTDVAVFGRVALNMEPGKEIERSELRKNSGRRRGWACFNPLSSIIPRRITELWDFV